MIPIFSQTLNGYEVQPIGLGPDMECELPSGPHLVSRTVAVGRTRSCVKNPNDDTHQTPEKMLTDINSRKLASTKECVTSHLLNRQTAEMGGDYLT